MRKLRTAKGTTGEHERPSKGGCSPLEDRLPERGVLMCLGSAKDTKRQAGISPAADEKTTYKRVKQLAVRLDDADPAKRKLAAETLRTAIESEKVDIFFAVPALERHISEPSLAMEAAIALTLHYLNNNEEKRIVRLLRDHGESAMEGVANVLCKETAAGNTTALSILIKGSLDENQAVRECCGEKLYFSLSNAIDDKTHGLIRSTILKSMDSN